MRLRVDIYSCNDCGRAIVVEENEELEQCPYKQCFSESFEYSHSGSVEND